MTSLAPSRPLPLSRIVAIRRRLNASGKIATRQNVLAVDFSCAPIDDWYWLPAETGGRLNGPARNGRYDFTVTGTDALSLLEQLVATPGHFKARKVAEQWVRHERPDGRLPKREPDVPAPPAGGRPRWSFSDRPPRDLTVDEAARVARQLEQHGGVRLGQQRRTRRSGGVYYAPRLGVAFGIEQRDDWTWLVTAIGGSIINQGGRARPWRYTVAAARARHLLQQLLALPGDYTWRAEAERCVSNDTDTPAATA